MPTNTPKFNLIKPLKSEKYNVDVFNGNADIIDSQIYSKTEVDTALNGKANTTTTVNNQPLSSNIIINASGVPNTPAGNISATNVQNAINELDTEKAPTVHTHDDRYYTETEVNTLLNAKANIVQEAWIVPTLLNSWVSADVPRQARYMKDTIGFVHLRGRVLSGTIGQLIFVLPLGYRPSSNLLVPIVSNAAFGLLLIDSGGSVTCIAGNNASVLLDAISFSST